MPRFSYVAQDGHGHRVTGAVGASCRREALGLLINRNLTPVRLREENSQTARRRIKASDLESFFEMLADLLGSGIPLAKSMDLLCQRTPCVAMRHVAESLRDDVIDGSTLADSMAKHSGVFRPITLSLVEAGEQSGLLENSLAQLAEFTRREQELRGRVLGALAYPAFLLVVGFIVMTGMMLFFVPKFEPLFSRMQESGNLPWATTALLGTSEFLRDNAMIILAAVAGVILIVVTGTTTLARRVIFDEFRVRLPWVGPIFVDMAIARFARVLGTMLQGGVPIVTSLEISRHALGVQKLSDAVMSSSASVQAGGSLTDPLRECGLFPIELTEMISVGEQSNRLEKVLLAIATKLEKRTQRQLDVLVKLIEPCLMVVMACLVGVLIVALLLPVFDSAGRFY